MKLLSDGNGGGEGAIPAVGYTQRATIDCVRYIKNSVIEYNVSLIRGEIHVMTGLNKDKDKDKRSGETRVSNLNAFTSKCKYVHMKIQN